MPIPTYFTYHKAYLSGSHKRFMHMSNPVTGFTQINHIIIRPTEAYCETDKNTLGPNKML